MRIRTQPTRSGGSGRRQSTPEMDAQLIAAAREHPHYTVRELAQMLGYSSPGQVHARLRRARAKWGSARKHSGQVQGDRAGPSRIRPAGRRGSRRWQPAWPWLNVELYSASWTIRALLRTSSHRPRRPRCFRQAVPWSQLWAMRRGGRSFSRRHGTWTCRPGNQPDLSRSRREADAGFFKPVRCPSSLRGVGAVLGRGRSRRSRLHPLIVVPSSLYSRLLSGWMPVAK